MKPDLIKAWGKPHSQEQKPRFSLPPQNPYIPSDFALIECSQVCSMPAPYLRLALAHNVRPEHSLVCPLPHAAPEALLCLKVNSSPYVALGRGQAVAAMQNMSAIWLLSHQQ